MFKSCPAQVKAAGTEDGLKEGQFRALVSVFGNADSYGDVVVKGAFADTLAEWSASGDAIPVYWSHQLADPDMNIGWLDDAQETDDGLEVLASLDLDPDAPPKARQVYRLLKGRRVNSFSFSYDVIDGGQVERDGDSVFELRKVKLYEVGPTPVGANPETELLAVKHLPGTVAGIAAEVKAGRVLSTKNESTLREALGSLQASASQIENVLAAVTNDDGKANQHHGKASGDAPATAQEPSPATAQEPKRQPSVNTWATYLRLAEME